MDMAEVFPFTREKRSTRAEREAKIKQREDDESREFKKRLTLLMNDGFAHLPWERAKLDIELVTSTTLSRRGFPTRICDCKLSQGESK
jgi:hypothetical protein